MLGEAIPEKADYWKKQLLQKVLCFGHAASGVVKELNFGLARFLLVSIRALYNAPLLPFTLTIHDSLNSGKFPILKTRSLSPLHFNAIRIVQFWLVSTLLYSFGDSLKFPLCAIELKTQQENFPIEIPHAPRPAVSAFRRTLMGSHVWQVHSLICLSFLIADLSLEPSRVLNDVKWEVSFIPAMPNNCWDSATIFSTSSLSKSSCGLFELSLVNIIVSIIHLFYFSLHAFLS